MSAFGVRAVIAGLALVVLAGCAQFPTQMQGRFEAERDFILIQKGGWIYWSSKSETDQPPRQVGIGGVSDETPLHVFVTVHSTSSFRPRLDFSSDYSRVTVDWGEVTWGGADQDGEKRSTEYVRARPR